MGHTCFGQKKPISRRSCHKAMPPRRKRDNGRRMSKGSDFATKSPAMPGFSIFGDFLLLIIVNRISAVKTAIVKAATI
jgi:hypothetical protein